MNASNTHYLCGYIKPNDPLMLTKCYANTRAPLWERSLVQPLNVHQFNLIVVTDNWLEKYCFTE